MTHADIIDVRGLSLSAASSAAVERFDALIDDLYYYRLGVQDRLDALLQEFPEFVLAHVFKGAKPANLPVEEPTKMERFIDNTH